MNGNSGGGALLIVLCLLVWGLSKLGGSAGRGATAHGHGPLVRLHEGGHLSAADRIGAKVSEAWVREDEGVVSLAHPEKLTPREYMAFMKAGEAAAGGRGCRGDRGNVAQERDRLRSAGWTEAEIRRTERLAEGDARAYARRAGKFGAKL